MGQVVLLIGEPGLGKSRLAYTLKEHVLGQMVEGQVDAPSSSAARRTSEHRVVPGDRILWAGARLRPRGAPQARFDRLLRRLEAYDLARPETVPLWASLLSLPAPEHFPPRCRRPG